MVLPIGTNAFFLFLLFLIRKVQEVDCSVHFIVVVFWIIQHKCVPHIGREILPVEVIIPSTALRHHEES